MQLPYITAHLAGIGGQIRHTADHFLVEELPLYLPQDEGSHLYLSISKVGLTTKEVIDRLERLFGLRRGEVGYAGLKDKHARTTQTLSMPLLQTSPASIEAAVDRIRNELPVELHWARLHRNKLKPGHLLGNRFQIIVSGMGKTDERLLAEAHTIAESILQFGIPNYFGQQRFGVGGDNSAQGQAILAGTRSQRDPWLRRLLISSFQSDLCNRYLALRVQAGNFSHILLGDIAKKYETGGMFDVADLASEQPRYLAHEISFTAPMFGYKMRQASAEAGQLEAQILAEAGVKVEDWRKARVEGTRRLGRLLVTDLTVQVVKNVPRDLSGAPITNRDQPNNFAGAPDRSFQDNYSDQTIPTESEKFMATAENQSNLQLSFSLPKGAFATTVLREFMKNDYAEIEQGEDEGED